MTAPEDNGWIVLFLWLVAAGFISTAVHSFPCYRQPQGSAWSQYGKPEYTGPSEGTRITQHRIEECNK